MRTTKSYLSAVLAIGISLTVSKFHLGIGVFCACLVIVGMLSALTWRACRRLRTRTRIVVTTGITAALLYLPISGPLYFAVRSVHAHQAPSGPTAGLQEFFVNELFGAPIGSLMQSSPAVHDGMTRYLESWDDSGLAVHHYFYPPPEDTGTYYFYIALTR